MDKLNALKHLPPQEFDEALSIVLEEALTKRMAPLKSALAEGEAPKKKAKK